MGKVVSYGSHEGSALGGYLNGVHYGNFSGNFNGSTDGYWNSFLMPLCLPAGTTLGYSGSDNDDGPFFSVIEYNVVSSQ